MTDFPLKLEKDQRTELVRLFQHYLDAELGVETGELAAGFLVDFAGRTLGPLYYNAGLRDAHDAARQHADMLAVDIGALEREVDSQPS